MTRSIGNILAMTPAFAAAAQQQHVRGGQGMHVVIGAVQQSGELAARFVAVGKNGLNPPMSGPGQ